MKNKITDINLTVDGFDVSVTFSESSNTAISNQVKQILLSSFVNHTLQADTKDILEISHTVK